MTTETTPKKPAAKKPALKTFYCWGDDNWEVCDYEAASVAAAAERYVKENGLNSGEAVFVVDESAVKKFREKLELVAA